ncbi:MAG: type II toxin-antitoxin system VapC family toxin [Gemmatimonas sp.]
MILVDTSVWIDHLNGRVPHLDVALTDALVLCHPLVLGELACGGMKQRRKVMQLLSELPLSPVVAHEEAMSLIEQRSLMGKGLSFADVHLLASAAIGDSISLWTHDKRLFAVADSMGLAFRP